MSASVMKPAIDYWHGLKAQEQKLLIVASSVFVVFCFVMLIYRPLNQAIESSKNDLKKQQELSVWMQTSIAKIKAADPKASMSSGSLSQIVNRSRGRFNIDISKMQPKDDSLRLTIDSVKFNDLVAWLTLLVTKNNVTIATIDMNRDDDSGFVKVSRLVLEK